MHKYKNGRVKVEYCLEHAGHMVEIARLKISAEERAQIAKLLEDGNDTASVVEKLRGIIHQ